MDRDPRVLFGAFDRHNQGDPLFPRIVTALRPDEEFVFAGIARRDPRGGACSPAGGRVDSRMRIIRSAGSRWLRAWVKIAILAPGRLMSWVDTLWRSHEQETPGG